MQEYIQEIETIIGRSLTNNEYQICYDLHEEYNIGDIVHHIELSKYKERPIHYARAVILKSGIKKKNESSGSEWWDNLKKQL